MRTSPIGLTLSSRFPFGHTRPVEGDVAGEERRVLEATGGRHEPQRDGGGETGEGDHVVPPAPQSRRSKTAAKIARSRICSLVAQPLREASTVFDLPECVTAVHAMPACDVADMRPQASRQDGWIAPF